MSKDRKQGAGRTSRLRQAKKSLLIHRERTSELVGVSFRLVVDMKEYRYARTMRDRLQKICAVRNYTGDE